MRRGLFYTVLAALVLVLAFGTGAWGEDSPSPALRYWPQWRGPLGTGEAPHADPPIEWSETKNVKWKVFLPGLSHASPVVWGSTVFVVSAIPLDSGPSSTGVKPGTGRRSPYKTTDRMHKFVLLALDRRSGQIKWTRTALKDVPAGKIHKDGSWASGSPVTDGECVVVYFGSRGLFCYGMDGTLQWHHKTGAMKKARDFGEGASPALWKDHVVVVQDHEGPSYIAAYHRKTGKQLWRTERDEKTSWATPVIVDRPGGAQVVTTGFKKVRGYDLATGRKLWEGPGAKFTVIATPVCTAGRIYFMSGIGGRGLSAIRWPRDAGEVTPDLLSWSVRKGIPETPSPLLYGNCIYYLRKNSAALGCVDATTGKKRFETRGYRMVGTVYASPVAAAGRVYLVSRKGVCLTIDHGDEPWELSRNVLDDSFSATPAIVGKEIFLRGRRNLYCIARKKP